MKKMDYNIKYDENISAVVITTSGYMNGQDFVDMAVDILKSPHHHTGGNSVFDHRKLDFSVARTDDLQRIRAFHMENEDAIGAGRSAIVVAEGEVDSWYRLWEQGEKIRTANEVNVFDDIDEAVKWVKNSSIL